MASQSFTVQYKRVNRAPRIDGSKFFFEVNATGGDGEASVGLRWSILGNDATQVLSHAVLARMFGDMPELRIGSHKALGAAGVTFFFTFRLLDRLGMWELFSFIDAGGHQFLRVRFESESEF